MPTNTNEDIEYFDTWMKKTTEKNSCIKECWERLRFKLKEKQLPSEIQKCTCCGRQMYSYCSVCDGSVHHY